VPNSNTHKGGNVIIVNSMGVQTFYGTEPHSLLWAGSRAARGKVKLSSAPNLLKYCVIYKYGRGPQNTSCRAAGWGTHAVKRRD
jgi:hypothetical protein